MRKFSSINQFRHVVESVSHTSTYIGQSEQNTPLYDESLPKPVLTFTGTTKLHGSNCGVGFDLETGEFQAQSREQILSLEQDNHGFCAWVKSEKTTLNLHLLQGILKSLYAKSDASKTGKALKFYVYGEWCGPGVNGKTGIGQVPNSWYIFGVVVHIQNGGDLWISVDQISSAWENADAWHDVNANTLRDIQFITDFKQWSLDINFNDPGHIIDELERLTLEVEAVCPVAQALGVQGIGEGIVWTLNDPKFGKLMFKTKGDKHKGTQTKHLVTVAPEIIEGIQAFTDAVVTESRLQQGFDLLQTQHRKVTLDHVGDFLKWVGMDVIKEESDTLKASGLDRKDVMGSVNKQAKKWLMPRLAKF